MYLFLERGKGEQGHGMLSCTCFRYGLLGLYQSRPSALIEALKSLSGRRPNILSNVYGFLILNVSESEMGLSALISS